MPGCNNLAKAIKEHAASKGLHVKHLFAYGSQIYGTATDSSDFDFYLVVDNSFSQKNDQQYWHINGVTCNLNIVSQAHFKELLVQHGVGALECVNTPELLSGKHLKLAEIDKSTLRKSFSEKSSNSWVKAKKKMLQGDEYVGKKSFFHSLRILCFGIQLAKTGKITDFSQATTWWLDILTAPSYEYLAVNYKPIYNALHSEFKRVAPL